MSFLERQSEVAVNIGAMTQTATIHATLAVVWSAPQPILIVLS